MNVNTDHKRLLIQQAIRFLMTGVLNTIVGYSLYALFLAVGLSYSLALSASTILGVLFNFKTIGNLVFKSNDNTLIVKFIIVYVITFCANLAIIKGFVGLGLNAYTAGIIAIIPLSVVSFIANKYFVFKR